MKIKVLKDHVAWEGEWSRVIERDFIGVHGEREVYEVHVRKTHGPVAIIIPVTTAGELIFIKHFRVPRKEYVLETPAGIMDIKGENPATLARRELLEETGYRARSMKLIAKTANNAGLMNDDYYFFVATGCEKIADPTLEGAEEIETILVPLKKVEAFISQRRNFSVAAPLYGIPYFLKKAGIKI